MPSRSDDTTPRIRLDPSSDAFQIIGFLARDSGGFTKPGINSETDLPAEELDNVLQQLEDRGTVDEATLDELEPVITSLREVERSTVYDLEPSDPEDHRIGTDSVEMDSP